MYVVCIIKLYCSNGTDSASQILSQNKNLIQFTHSTERQHERSQATRMPHMIKKIYFMFHRVHTPVLEATGSNPTGCNSSRIGQLPTNALFKRCVTTQPPFTCTQLLRSLDLLLLVGVVVTLDETEVTSRAESVHVVKGMVFHGSRHNAHRIEVQYVGRI